MLKPVCIGLLTTVFLASLSGCAKGELDKALDDPSVPVGSVITIGDKKYKKVRRGVGVACTGTCD